MKKLEEALKEAIRVEYVTSPERPSLRALAAKYGVAIRTVEKYSAQEQWRAQRESYWRTTVVDNLKQSARQSAARAVRGNESERERTAKMIKWLRDYLVGLAREVGRGLVPTANDPQETIQEIRRAWAQLPAATRARLLPQIVRTAGELIRIEQLLMGEPTERIEMTERPIEVTDEEAEVLQRVWRRATMMAKGEDNAGD